jgi:hypothetical protein
MKRESEMSRGRAKSVLRTFNLGMFLSSRVAWNQPFSKAYGMTVVLSFKF